MTNAGADDDGEDDVAVVGHVYEPARIHQSSGSGKSGKKKGGRDAHEEGSHRSRESVSHSAHKANGPGQSETT